MAQDPRALLQKVRAALTPLPLQQQTDKVPRQKKRWPVPVEDSASSVEGQTSLRMLRNCTFRPQMHSECKNKVCLASHNLFNYLISAILDKEAGQAFEKAASVQRDKLNEPDDAANSLQEAFKVYKKTDPEDAARVLAQAINHYTSKGNFRRAATHQQNLAEVYEVEIGDTKRALSAYETAAEWFENDNAEA